MKKYFFKNIPLKVFTALICILISSSCNKDIPEPEPITKPVVADGVTIGDIINTDTSYSFFKAAATKVGVLASLTDKNNTYTLFLPTNSAFRFSGIPSEAALETFPVETVGAILSYHIIPGQQLLSADIPTTFPNLREPSALTIGTLPGTAIPVKMFIFPSKRANGFWVNNIPVVAPDKIFQNGVIHEVAAIVSPASMVLAQMIYGDPQFSIFAAVIARGDSGQAPGFTTRIDSALKFPLANLTVFAPTNSAFKGLISALTGGLIPTAAPDEVFVSFVSTMLPVRNARGIVAYHIMGDRAFSVNFPNTPTFFPTLLNGAIPQHPGVQVQASFTGPFGTGLKVTGVGNGGMAATALPFDKTAVNGVLHVIDKVLLPQ
jgi:uncharacterized surface protein with fasciclin (FAS1) repeats